jgi:hypothetical protein
MVPSQEGSWSTAALGCVKWIHFWLNAECSLLAAKFSKTLNASQP